MSVADLAIVAALVFGWGALSARLERFDVTAPIAFVVAGLLLTHGPLAFLSVTPSKELIKELAEFTLALVLFSDASRVGLHELRVDAGLYLRLLGVALPLTIGLGTLLALALDRSAGIWLALLVGAALAPTDAALGAGMLANPVVPARIRRLINVESGLNDGIATPFVSVALAGAATGGHVAGHGPAAAVAELALGILIGVAAGGAGGLLVNAARKRGWVAEALPARRCWAWRCAPTHPRWRCTATGSSPRSSAGSRSAPRLAGAASPCFRSSRKPARWCPCWSGWRSALSQSHLQWRS